MLPRLLALAALLALPAHAQDLAPAPPPTQSAEPPPLEPLPTSTPASTPTYASLNNVTASLSAPRQVSGPVPLILTLRSSRAAPLALAAARDNDQNCAAAPTVRVLRVGTREVVYPAPEASPLLCTQELLNRSVPAGGSVTFTRDLALPAGEYMIEGWFAGFADNLRVKVPAQPVRVTVR